MILLVSYLILLLKQNLPRLVIMYCIGAMGCCVLLILPVEDIPGVITLRSPALCTVVVWK